QRLVPHRGDDRDPLQHQDAVRRRQLLRRQPGGAGRRRHAEGTPQAGAGRPRDAAAPVPPAADDRGNGGRRRHRAAGARFLPPPADGRRHRRPDRRARPRPVRPGRRGRAAVGGQPPGGPARPREPSGWRPRGPGRRVRGNRSRGRARGTGDHQLGRGDMSTADVDFERFRLRTLVEELTRAGEVEVHDEPVALADLSSVIEASDKAVLFRNAGPEKVELAAGVMGSRRRLAIALGVDERDSLREYERRLASPQRHFEVPSADAPVHQVVLAGDDIDLTKLPFYLQHDLDGGPYISSAIDFSVDPASGRHNVGCRRLMLRGRKHLRTNLTAPSDLKLAYRAAVERGERFPISFAVGSHPTAFMAGTSRGTGDEFDLVATLRGAPLPMVRGVTNGVPAPADAEMIIEGYLDELGYRELDGPYGEFMGFYGAAHIDPVFHVTAIAMRADVLHQSILHGGRNITRMEMTPMAALQTESALRAALRAAKIEPAAVYPVDGVPLGKHVRVALDQAAAAGQARAVISALFALPGVMHVVVV